MRLIKQTDEYVVDTEEQAIALIEKFRKTANDEGYIVGANGYTLKEKKSKGEVVAIHYVVKITKVFGGVWDDYE